MSNPPVLVCHAVVAVIRPPFIFLTSRPPPRSTLFPYTTLFRSTLDPVSSDVSLPNHAESSLLDRITRFRRRAVKRSEEHTSELQSRGHLVCRLLLEKKK